MVSMIIGLTGTLASGKGTVADVLKREGFVYLSLSDELREILKENSIELSRKNLQDWGNRMREENGPEYLAVRVTDKMRKMGCARFVVDGIRNPAEIEHLRKMRNFFLIAVDAPQETRFRRIRERAREDAPTAWEEFLRQDERDRGVGEASTGQGVERCMSKADYLIGNEGSVEKVSEKVHEIISELGKKARPLSWDEYFMTFARVAAQKSKDPSTKVGACIVDDEKRVVGLGYNGFPKHCDDDKLPMDREGPFLETKYAYVVHAEPNAILNSTKNTKGCRIYVTLFPCNECAKLIIQAGIKEVVYEEDKYAGTEIVEASKRLFRSAGIKMRQFTF